MVLERQVTLITGASRGFGLAAAEELTDRGHPVIATMRNPDRDGPNLAGLDAALVEIAQCDVTDRASIDAAVAAGLNRFGRVDALFNNAGYGLYGPVEDMSDDEVSRQMDTNFSGQIRMAQAVLPAMREQRHGKIINVSSLAGRIVAPLMGLYAASKWAVEAMSEALRYEVSRWNVDVTILEPGMYASDWQTTNLDVAAAVREGRSPLPGVCRTRAQDLPHASRHAAGFALGRHGSSRHCRARTAAADALASRRRHDPDHPAP